MATFVARPSTKSNMESASQTTPLTQTQSPVSLSRAKPTIGAVMPNPKSASAGTNHACEPVLARASAQGPGHSRDTSGSRRGRRRPGLRLAERSAANGSRVAQPCRGLQCGPRDRASGGGMDDEQRSLIGSATTAHGGGARRTWSSQLTPDRATDQIAARTPPAEAASSAPIEVGRAASRVSRDMASRCRAAAPVDRLAEKQIDDVLMRQRSPGRRQQSSAAERVRTDRFGVGSGAIGRTAYICRSTGCTAPGA